MMRLLRAITGAKFTELSRITGEDPTLMKLAKYISEERPHPTRIETDLKSYSAIQDEPSVENGVIYRGLTVPKRLQADYLSQVHKGHLGIASTRRRARDVMYWPGMNEAITEMATQC